jgi:hypothetical protein
VRLETPFCGADLEPVTLALRAELEALEIYPARADQVAEARRFAAQLIGGAIVSPEGLQRVHEHSGAGLFLYHDEEELTGVLAIVLLSQAGLAATCDETFNALNPDLKHVAAEGEPPAGLYGWGIAATRKMTARRLVDGLSAIANGAVGHLPYFARAATPQGERLLIDRLGFRPYPGSTTGLLKLDPYLGGRIAA